MTSHTPHVVSAADLHNLAMDHRRGCDPLDFPDIFTEGFDLVPEVAGKWFALQWPEHCVTEQHLADATIYGPYETQAEAQAAAE